ncbi:unannotated protein [freshwater metagenome]|uniref:Unannotated protein n=1 Tax=freshwater metagenome TaxID=449393 RepID=A0A6J7N8E5_9ZZZZ
MTSNDTAQTAMPAMAMSARTMISPGGRSCEMSTDHPPTSAAVGDFGAASISKRWPTAKARPATKTIEAKTMATTSRP